MDKEFIDDAISLGIIESNELGWIPELYVQAEEITDRLFHDFLEYDDFDSSVYLMWCFFSGVAAVYIWISDQGIAKDKNLYEVLIDKRGLDYLDEYTLDQMGIPISTEKGQKYGISVMALAVESLGKANEKEGKNPETIKKILRSLSKDFYQLGITRGSEMIGNSN